MTVREDRKEKGLCMYCGGSMDRKGYYCSSCTEKHNEWKFELVIQKVIDGLCSTCGKPMDREGWFCTSCALKLNTHAKERNAIRRAAHLCVQCGAPSGLKRYCRRCLDMRKKYYYKKFTKAK